MKLGELFKGSAKAGAKREANLQGIQMAAERHVKEAREKGLELDATEIFNKIVKSRGYKLAKKIAYIDEADVSLMVREAIAKDSRKAVARYGHGSPSNRATNHGH